MRSCLPVMLGAALVLPVPALADAPTSARPVAALRALAVQVERTRQQADAGQVPTAARLDGFARTLARLRTTRHGDAALQAKLDATSALLSAVRAPRASAATPALPERRRPDLETLSAGHGDSCASALGLAADTAVRLTLSRAGASGSDAWLRVNNTADAAAVRIWTESAGPDPALEVSRACGNDVPLAARNDDALGLDAAVVMDTPRAQPLYVHLRNTGDAGIVVVNAAPAPQTVSGVVRDAKSGTPIPNVSVTLYTSSGFTFGSANSDANGAYLIAASVPGNFYVYASVSGYVPGLYPAVQCKLPAFDGFDTCDTSAAQQITVNANAATQSVNLLLSTGQHLRGQVRDAGNSPLGYAELDLYDGVSNAFIFSTLADVTGHFDIDTVPVGTYKLLGRANGYGSQMYAHLACDGPLQQQCDINKATRIPITNQDVLDANMTLPALAGIEGSVTDATGAPLGYAEVVVLSDIGSMVTSAIADDTGHFRAGPLPLGKYYVYATVASYFDQLFGGFDCDTACNQDLASATPITIASTGQVAAANFQLHPLPLVHGHVTDALSGLPLVNTGIAIRSTPPSGTGYFPPDVFTDANGNYASNEIGPGHYYVWATSDDHIDQVYPAIACEANDVAPGQQSVSCNVAGAVLLTIVPGQTPGAFDFALDKSAAISGHAFTRAGPGSTLVARTTVRLYDASAAVVAYAQPDESGSYALGDLTPGTYYVAALGGSNQYNYSYLGQVWPMLDCSGTCAPTTGAPVTVNAAAGASGIDFVLTQLDAVVGRVTDSNGNGIGGVEIDLFDTTQQFVAAGIANADGYYSAVWDDGSYYVATEAGGGYVDQAHAGIQCPLGPVYFGQCSLAGATAVSISGQATQPRIVDFALAPSDRIFANGFE